MKRKNSPNPDPVVAPEILVSAKRAVNEAKRDVNEAKRVNETKHVLESERPRVPAKCVVCGAETTADAAEHLCWVCRRLKISAWRDIEQQMPAQE